MGDGDDNINFNTSLFPKGKARMQEIYIKVKCIAYK